MKLRNHKTTALLAEKTPSSGDLECWRREQFDIAHCIAPSGSDHSAGGENSSTLLTASLHPAAQK